MVRIGSIGAALCLAACDPSIGYVVDVQLSEPSLARLSAPDAGMVQLELTNLDVSGLMSPVVAPVVDGVAHFEASEIGDYQPDDCPTGTYAFTLGEGDPFVPVDPPLTAVAAGGCTPDRPNDYQAQLTL